jgi:hypothetical protein
VSDLRALVVLAGDLGVREGGRPSTSPPLKRIVEEHGGTIEIENGTAAGITFRITFPRVRTPARRSSCPRCIGDGPLQYAPLMRVT